MVAIQKRADGAEPPTGRPARKAPARKKATRRKATTPKNKAAKPADK